MAIIHRMQDMPQLRVRFFLDIQRAKDDTTASNLLVSKFSYRFRQYQWPADRPLPDVYYYPVTRIILAPQMSKISLPEVKLTEFAKVGSRMNDVGSEAQITSMLMAAMRLNPSTRI